MKRIIQAFSNEEFETQKLALDSVKDIILIFLDGEKIKNQFDLYQVFQNLITFPSYFGNNRNAFQDIITDKDFVNKQTVVMIRNYKKMFSDLEDMKTFSRILIYWLGCNYIDCDISIYIS